MKRVIYIMSIITIMVGSDSCREPERVPGFEDADQLSMYNYILNNQEEYSVFLSIIKVGGLDKTLSAYNPYGNGYTLFLPSNKAIDNFIQNTEGFSSVNDILKNPQYAAAFAKYHVVNMSVHTQDFPFGAFLEPTLSEDYLTVSFIIQPDTSYYKINNQAAVIYPKSKVSIGYFL